MDRSLFRSRRLLESLATAAVGVCLAAATGAAFNGIFRSDNHIGLVSTGTTLVIGTIWAHLLRSPRLLRGTNVRAGWVLSIPLAALNAALAAGLLFASGGGAHVVREFLVGMLAGATLGAYFWVPALVLTLLCFGLPIARGQRLARQGLAGQERGDAFVGAVCALLASLALVSSLVAQRPGFNTGVVAAVSALGLTLGASVVALATLRDRLRRAFVARVEAGEEPRFRVEPTSEGRVLVRVVSQGEGYRVADFVEEVAALDRDGAVTRARG